VGLGGEPLTALLQESLSVAHKTQALARRDLERVVVDTTVQSKPALAKAGGDHGWLLHPCASLQAGPARGEIPAHPAGPGDR
jgi:hypothetical protein